MAALSDDLALEAAAAFKAHKDQSAAARSLGLNRRTFTDRLAVAAQRGMLGTKPVLPGFRISQTTAVTNEAGELIKEFVQQKPERGDDFAIPEGHLIKGVSALVDPDGRVIQQWIKTKVDEAIVDITKALKDSFADYDGHATLPRAPRHTDKDLATIYPVADHHLGLYAWAEEVGENYDLSIGSKLLMDTMASLVANAPCSRIGVVLNLGDFFHSDNNDNRTRRGGNALDVDTRYAKILRVGVDLLIHCVQLALQKHEKVIVRCLPGNHDPYAALALATALGAFFSNSKRVEIDADPSAFWWWRFGKVLLGSTHGDMIKAADMPGVMAARCPQEWGATEYRYVYLGHVHHRSVGGGERAGVVWETFQTLSPKDDWHHRSGYSSGRSMVAITHHRAKGEVMRNTVSVKGPK